MAEKKGKGGVFLAFKKALCVVGKGCFSLELINVEERSLILLPPDLKPHILLCTSGKYLESRLIPGTRLSPQAVPPGALTTGGLSPHPSKTK